MIKKGRHKFVGHKSKFVSYKGHFGDLVREIFSSPKLSAKSPPKNSSKDVLS